MSPTHGSLNKAGRVRDTTPKIPVTNTRKRLIPRVKNRRKYEKMLKDKGRRR